MAVHNPVPWHKPTVPAAGFGLARVRCRHTSQLIKDQTEEEANKQG